MDAIVRAVAVQENMDEVEIAQHVGKIRRAVICRIKEVVAVNEGPDEANNSASSAASGSLAAASDVFSADIMRIQQAPPPAPNLIKVLRSWKRGLGRVEGVLHLVRRPE
ncbi:hypothetical protein V7S43_013824 [Phytophthora oleae]